MSSHEKVTPNADNRTQVQQVPEATSSDDVNATSPNFGTFMGPSVPGYPFLSQPQASGEIGRLGDYRVLAKLGEGGMGFVFRAEDPALKRFVALKVMRPEVAAKPLAADRFLREGRAAAGLKSDHIITIYQVGQANGAPFIAMEYLEGIALDEWMKQQKKAVPVPHVLRVVRDTLRGLATAHDKGLIHRDIKPANLWIEKGTARIKVLDFGLTRGMDGNDQMTADGAVVGTPAYMAPEQAAGKPVDPRADLFSVGTVMYQLFLGINPFVRNNMMATMGAVSFDVQPPVIALRPEVPQAYSDYLDRLLAKDPAGRPANAKAALAELAAIEKSLQDTAKTLASSSSLPVVSMMAPAAAAMPAQVWGDITDTDDTVVRTKVSDPETPRKPPSKKLLIGSGLFAFFALILGGIVIIITNKDGTKTKVEVPDGATVDVQKDGKRVGGVSTPDLSSRKGGDEVSFEIADGVKMVFCWIPKGKATLGSPVTEKDRLADEAEHEFTTEGFWLAKTECTQKEWESVMGSNPSWFCASGMGKAKVQGMDTNNFPVEQVNWDDAQLFLKKLNAKGGVAKSFGKLGIFKLPHEDQWEYACRGGKGNKQAFYWGNSLNGDKANSKEGVYLERPNAVGSYAKSAPHAWGLSDMSGNVWEWCDNLYVSDLRRVGRGGCWRDGTEMCRSAFRGRDDPSYRGNGLGFRVCCVISLPEANAANVVMDADRKAAQIVIGSGGTIGIEGNERIADAKDLPKEPFKILQIGFNHGIDPKISDADLDLFRFLDSVTSFNVQGSITDAGFAKLATFPWVNRLTNLGVISEELTDAAFASAAKFTSLQSLSLTSKRITGSGIAHLKASSIVGLGINQCGLVDAEMVHLKAMPKLGVLTIIGTPIGDAGLKHISDVKLLEALQMQQCRIVTDEGFKHLENCSRLHLLEFGANAGVNLFTGACLKSIGKLNNLSSLGGPYAPAQPIEQNKFSPSDADLKHLLNCPNLERLGIGMPDLTDAGLETLSQLKKLKALGGLQGSKVTAAGVKKFRAALPECKVTSDFDVDAARKAAEFVISRGGRLTIEGNREITDAKDLPKEPFKILAIGFNHGIDLKISDADLDLFRLLDSVTTFNVQGPITDAGFAKLATFPWVNRLTHLAVISEELTDAAFASAAKFTSLQALTLQSKRITGSGIAHLKASSIGGLGINQCGLVDAEMVHLTAMPKLGVLTIIGTPIGDAGLKHISEVKLLESLQMQQCGNVTDEGFKHLENCSRLHLLEFGANGGVNLFTGACLKSIGKLSNLAALNGPYAAAQPIEQNKFSPSDADLKHLLNCPNLEYVGMGMPDLTDAGLETLSQLKKLKALVGLQGSKVTAAGVKKFRAALPECKVTSDFPE